MNLPNNENILSEHDGTVVAEIDETTDCVDPLLVSLLYVARHEHKPCSESSLIAGLPLVNGKLSPELAVRAAGRADLKAVVVERELSSVSELVLPAILILERNDAVVLLSINTPDQRARIYDPRTRTEKWVDTGWLQPRYAGYAIYFKPELKYEDRTPRNARLYKSHWFWGTIGQSWRIYRDVLLASFLINLFALANPLFVMNVYDRVVPNNAIETLWALALGVFCVYIFDFVLKLLRVYFIEVAGKKSDILLSGFIFERVLGARFDKHPKSVGAFVSQLKEFEAVRNFITSTTVTAFVDLPFVVLFLAVIAYIGGPVVWVPVVIIPFVVVFALVVQRLLQKSISHTFMASAQKNATLVEAMSGLETIKAMGAEGKAQRAWEKSVGMLAYWGLKSRILSNSALAYSGFMQQLASVVVVIVGVYAISENEMTMGALIACVLLTSRVLAPLAQVAGLLVQYQQSKLALSSLEDIVQQTQERPDNRTFVKRPSINGSLEFKDVVFSYPGEDQPTLSNISLKISAGEKVAIIGRLGSGKSTVQKLILGLYQPTSGAVLIDGIDAKQIDPADLRGAIAYVPQDNVLFYGTIRENIAYKNTQITDEEVIRVADVAGVGDFVNKHPLGFERVVSERGDNLSGGQRQAIVVARGLVGQPSIYIFDEPTTAMDNTSESRLLEKLMSEVKNKTLVLVTHKTSLLALIERVIVMDQGKIIADGPKAPVLEALKKGQLRVS